MVQIPKNELLLVKKAGGSIINKKSVFSNDGSVIFVANYSSVFVYNVSTGKLIKTYEPDIITHPIVNWSTLSKNGDILVICSNKGEIVLWNWRSNLQNGLYQLKVFTEAILEQVIFLSAESLDNIEILTTWNDAASVHTKVAIHYVQNNNYINVNINLERDQEYVVAAALKSQLYAIAQGNIIYFADGNDHSRSIRHMISEDRHFTAVACHPYEDCVASGDNTGRVLLWRNIFKRRPTQAVYHWHTLAVNCVEFSRGGTHLYTGGDECVLVKWVIDAPQNRNFLPRVVAPIKHISVSNDNMLVAFSMANNAIHVIDNQCNLKAILQNMSWGVVDQQNGDYFTAGLHYDAQSQSIVMNSYIGHIQFYSVFTNSINYHLDVTGHNQLTREQNANIINIDVTKIAMSKYSYWLATVEQRNDPEIGMESRLKFWNYNTNGQQNWILNTCASLPHQNGIADIKFKPSTSKFSETENGLCISIGDDKTFKLWSLIDASTIYNKLKAWRCIASGYYLNRQPYCLDFSYDGSLLAVGFGQSLTIWEPESCNLKHSLVYTSYSNEILKTITFGNGESSHLVVCTTLNRIYVWNLLSLTMLWTVPLQVNIICSDSKSSYIAAFTKTNKLYIFTPQNSHPVDIHENIAKNGSRLLQAIFVPHKVIKQTSNWQQYSQLYFITSEQELLTLEENLRENENYLETVMETVKTHNPFMSLKAQTFTDLSTYNKIDVNITRQELPGSVNIKQFIQLPAHTCAPMRYVYKSVLKSLLITKENKKSSETDNETNYNIDEFNFFKEMMNSTQLTGVDDDDSDNETHTIAVEKRNIKIVDLPDADDNNDVERIKEKEDEEEIKNILNKRFDWCTKLLA